MATELDWQAAPPTNQRMDGRKLAALGRELMARGTRAWLVLRSGQALIEEYAPGLGPSDRHGTASLAKSLVGGMSLLLALEDGRVQLDDPAASWISPWREDPVKSRITLRQLAAHTSGIEDSETLGRTHFDQGGWKEAFWRREPDPFSIAIHQAPVLFEPGSRFAYSNPGVAALAYALTAALRGGAQPDLRALLAARILRPLGVADADWTIGYEQAYPVDGLNLYAAWGGGAYTARAAARVGQLVLNRGQWKDEQLFSPQSLRQVLTPQPPYSPGLPAPASGWMTNANYLWNSLPRDAFVGAGAGHQVLLIVPSRGLVAVRFGSLLSSPADGPEFWASMDRHFFTPLMDCFLDRIPEDARQAPYPPSPVIQGISFDPPSTILRRANDSDNWPVTAGSGGWQYTAYGDGQGFEPYTGVKLGLGLARLRGSLQAPEGVGSADLQTENIRAPELENLGYGAKGRKASGLLMLGDVLYLMARNAANSRLAWSTDRGRTWAWCDWAFTQSFGHPGFINFGPNYAGARDDYVYLYSHDGDSAYQPADTMVMARVPQDALRERERYQFFAGLDAAGEPQWHADIARRAPVFSHPGRCLRSSMTYHPGLRRYLWWQQVPAQGEADTRFQGGFGIYDAPEPWGPWTTAYFTLEWDCGPGELGSLPTAWLSPGGRSAYLVFSGNDTFSVRRAWLRFAK